MKNKPGLSISFYPKSAKWKKLLTSFRPLFDRTLQACFDALELPGRDFAVAVSLVSDAEIQAMNAQYRAKDKPTNVLSFPMIDDFSVLDKQPAIPGMLIELGDIVLAFETIAREAEMEGKSVSDHVAHLLVHGMLHLFGYDHMTAKDAKEMEGLEIAILESLGIADPY